MKYNFDYSNDKDLILKDTRGIGFGDIVDAIKKGNLLDNIKNPKAKYPKQRMFVVKIKDYVYLVPFVADEEKGIYFLKTLYPNREATRKYLKK